MSRRSQVLVIGLALGCALLGWLALRGGHGSERGLAAPRAGVVSADERGRADATLVDAEGGAPARQRLRPDVPDGRSETAPTVADPVAATASLTVRVTHDVLGRGNVAFPGVAVRLRVGGPSLSIRPTRTIDRFTEADGSTTFADLAPGTYEVVAVRAIPRAVRLTAGAHEVVHFEIEAGITIRGEVLDQDGAPVPEAEILLSERWMAQRVARAGVADGAGRFTLEEVGLDTFVSARAPGFVASRQLVPRGKPGDTLEVVLHLEDRGVHVGGVVLAVDGAPHAQAIVTLGPDPLGWDTVNGLEWMAPAPLLLECDGEGRFETREAPAGDVLVRAYAERHARYSAQLEIGPAGARDLVLQLEPEAVVQGIVRDSNGEPVPTALVSTGFEADDHRTFSDSSGRYVLDGLSSGSYELDARHDRSGRATDRQVLGTGERLQWDPVLLPSPSIRGRVLDERGAGVAGLQVIAIDKEAALSHGTQTRADGGFHLPHLEDRAYQINVQKPAEWREFPLASADDVRPSDELLLLRLGAEGDGRLEATLFGPDGTPVTGARLTVWHAEKRLWREVTAEASTGRVSATGVPPGVLVLGLEAPGFGATSLGERTLAPGATLDLGELRLPEVGEVFFTLLGVTPEQAATFEVALVALDSQASVPPIEPEGLVVKAEGLPVGRWRAEVRGRRVLYEPIEFIVEAGGTTRASLPVTVAGGYRVVIRVPPELRPQLACWVEDLTGKVVWRCHEFEPEGDAWVAYPSAPAGRGVIVVRYGEGRGSRTEVGFSGAPDDGEIAIDVTN